MSNDNNTNNTVLSPEEIANCIADPVHFITNYCKIEVT